jgi:prolyl oligopeptidase
MAQGYPLARRNETADLYHGIRITDPYRWLEDPSDPEAQT